MTNKSGTLEYSELASLGRNADVRGLPEVRIALLSDASTQLLVPLLRELFRREGLDALDGEQLLTANDKVHFANQVARLLSDTELQMAITRRARDFAVKPYDGDVIAGQLLTVYD